jgi:hypothetical protein
MALHLKFTQLESIPKGNYDLTFSAGITGGHRVETNVQRIEGGKFPPKIFVSLVNIRRNKIETHPVVVSIARKGKDKPLFSVAIPFSALIVGQVCTNKFDATDQTKLNKIGVTIAFHYAEDGCEPFAAPEGPFGIANYVSTTGADGHAQVAVSDDVKDACHKLYDNFPKEYYWLFANIDFIRFVVQNSEMRTTHQDGTSDWFLPLIDQI